MRLVSQQRDTPGVKPEETTTIPFVKRCDLFDAIL